VTATWVVGVVRATAVVDGAAVLAVERPIAVAASERTAWSVVAGDAVLDVVVEADEVVVVEEVVVEEVVVGEVVVAAGCARSAAVLLSVEKLPEGATANPAIGQTVNTVTIAAGTAPQDRPRRTVKLSVAHGRALSPQTQ
jgi:hypothetical protein